MTGPTIPVHFYVPTGETFAQKILCGNPEHGINTHVTEYGTQVTCAGCVAILRDREQDVTE